MEQATQEMKKYCAQCGTAAGLQARFCASCGFDMTAVVQPALQARVLDQLDQQDLQQQESPAVASSSMDLGMAWMIYFVALLLWIGTLVLPLGPFATLVYLASGFVMTRYVMRGLIEFHPVYNTVANVFSAKIWMFLLWPIQMFVLLFKLTVNSTL